MLKLPECLIVLSESLTTQQMIVLLEQILQSLQLASQQSISSKMKVLTELMSTSLLKHQGISLLFLPFHIAYSLSCLLLQKKNNNIQWLNL